LGKAVAAALEDSVFLDKILALAESAHSEAERVVLRKKMLPQLD
jgi:hypothetical protein